MHHLFGIGDEHLYKQITQDICMNTEEQQKKDLFPWFPVYPLNRINSDRFLSILRHLHNDPIKIKYVQLD